MVLPKVSVTVEVQTPTAGIVEVIVIVSVKVVYFVPIGLSVCKMLEVKITEAVSVIVAVAMTVEVTAIESVTIMVDICVAIDVTGIVISTVCVIIWVHAFPVSAGVWIVEVMQVGHK